MEDLSEINALLREAVRLLGQIEGDLDDLKGRLSFLEPVGNLSSVIRDAKADIVSAIRGLK